MVGAIGLIRRKSKQLKNKLIKQEKDSHKGPEVQYDTGDVFPPARNSVSLSTDDFQLSPELRSRNSRHSLDIPYTRSNNNSRLSLDASFYKNNHHHSALNLSLPANRSSMDLGTVIKVPKRGSSPNNSNNINNANNNIVKFSDGRRKLLEFSSNNLNRSKSVRIKSDSSLLPSSTKSRPNSSIFIDADIPDISKKSDYLVTHISSVLDPNVKKYNNNNVNNHSSLILDTHETLHSTNQHNHKQNLGDNHNGSHHRHGHHDHHRRHRHSNRNKFEHENETAYISSSTPFNILFAIFFHIFNIVFTVFIYLPIYICTKIPYLVILSVIGGITAFLYYGIGSTTDNNMALNSLNTLNTHAIKG